MRRPEVLFFVAVIGGLIMGKLIKNFKVGMLVGLFVAGIYAFVSRPSKKK
jgi:uncharacterized membrane protein (UPF0136 family)